jgi:hypothetical protein
MDERFIELEGLPVETILRRLHVDSATTYG